MAHTRRAQVLMEPEDYASLEALARRRGLSVAELIRRAVRRCYLEPTPSPGETIDALLAMELDLDFGAPEDLSAELEEARCADLP